MSSPSTGHQSRRFLVLAFQRFNYQYLLPAIARFPLVLAHSLAVLRGLVNGLFDLEWRSVALNQSYIKSATAASIKKIDPQLSPVQVRFKVYLRFISFSLEELDSAFFARRDLGVIRRHSRLHGDEHWQKAISRGRGLVALTCHYDSFTMGMVLLAMQGHKVNAMSSNVVEDPRLSRHVQTFFDRKYRGMEKYFNGGRIVHIEQEPRFFYQALNRGEIVFILADLPDGNRNSEPKIRTTFLGGRYCMAPGPFRMALKSGSPMAAFYTLKQGADAYDVYCSEVIDPADDLQSSVDHLYGFLQAPIQRYPERWGASDLLNAYIAE